MVSERVRRAIEKIAPVGIEFYPVTPRRIGGRSPKSSPRIPASGEPEDMMQVFKVSKTTATIPTYYQVLVSAEAHYPPGAEPRSLCDVCGEEERPNWKEIDTAWKNLTPSLIASLSEGLEVFRIPRRGTVFISNRAKAALEALAASNVSFRPFPSEPVVGLKRKSKLR